MTLQQAAPLNLQPTLATKVWDILLKLTVAFSVGTGSWVVAIERRVSEQEYSIRRNAESIIRIESQQAEVQKKFDRILETLDSIGTRLTRIETKLETHK